MIFTKDLSNITRLKAFLIHLSISLVIFFILLYFILIQWYPQPLFSTDGGWRVIRIIIGVDLILGPLLTLIVFKPGKAGLKFDLVVIALIQTSALTWGIWTSYNERPVAIVYTLDYFTPVPAYQFKEAGIPLEQLKQYSEKSPLIIFSDIPENKVNAVLSESYTEGKPIFLMSEYYTQLEKKHASLLKKDSMNLEKYVADKPKLKKLYDDAQQKSKDTSNVSFIALHSRERWVTAVFDLDKMKIVDTIEIEPSNYVYSKEIKVIDKKGNIRTIKSGKNKAIN